MLDIMKHIVALTSACILLVGCAITQQADTLPAGTKPSSTPGISVHVDAGAMLGAHNRWRAKVGVKPLSWSKKLESIAGVYAVRLASQGCRMQHSRNDYGENLFWASPVRWSDGHSELQRVAEAEVVEAWGSEEKDYNYRSNSCSGTCGHYTQIIWRDTREVGCAARVCTDSSQIWVCNYNPPGNYRGVRPY